MKRSSRGRRVGVLAWALGLLVPAALLVAVFTWVDPVDLAGRWPLGIATREVDTYARWLDQRSADTTAVRPERYLFSSAADACMMNDARAGWSTHWFEAEGFGDSVRIGGLPTTPGGFVVEFRKEEPFRAHHRIVLIPADVGSIRMKYLEVLAGELGLVTPEVSFVRVIACGLDQGIFMKEERIGTDFLEKQGLAGASLFTQGHDAARPDHLFPAFDEDSVAGAMLRNTLELAYDDLANGHTEALPHIVDVQAGVALLLMEWIERDTAAFRGEHLFAYVWSKGRIVSLYRHASVDATASSGPVAMDFLTALMDVPAVRAAFNARRNQLVEERWRIKERFAAMDRAWLPILAQGASLARARATALAIQEELIGAPRDKQDPLGMMEHARQRGAGYATFAGVVASTRYWPTTHDAMIMERIAERTKAHVHADTLTFPRGKYAVHEDLTIPFGYTVVLEQGARFEIAAGRSVIVQGPLLVRGTARNPVFVRPMDAAAPFGTFAVVGDGATRCDINGLQLSGGSGARVNGIYFSGQFAVHNAALTRMNGCAIGGSFGEAAINIKGGAVQLRDCVFEDALVDLVDLDRCTGSVAGCVFRGGGRETHGDGLDVSGARILVDNCSFTRMRDKGISVGEASQLLVRGSRFDGNRIAVSATDLGIAYAYGNVFTGNNIVFGAHRMKPIHGGARVMRGANEYVGNLRDQEVDELSAVVAQEKLEASVLKAFGVE